MPIPLLSRKDGITDQRHQVQRQLSFMFLLFEKYHMEASNLQSIFMVALGSTQTIKIFRNFCPFFIFKGVRMEKPILNAK